MKTFWEEFPWFRTALEHLIKRAYDEGAYFADYDEGKIWGDEKTREPINREDIADRLLDEL